MTTADRAGSAPPILAELEARLRALAVEIARLRAAQADPLAPLAALTGRRLQLLGLLRAARHTPATAWLAARCGISRRAVRKALHWLAARQYIVIRSLPHERYLIDAHGPRALTPFQARRVAAAKEVAS